MSIIEISAIYNLIALILLVILAILAIESRSLVYCVISFALMSLDLGILFILLGAPFVGLLTIAIYAGAVTVLILAIIGIVPPQERRD